MTVIQFSASPANLNSKVSRGPEAQGSASASGILPLLCQFLRNARQAMIAAPVRTESRLIALPSHRTASVVPLSRGVFGFAEEEPLRFDIAPKRSGGSAGKFPQRCGQVAAVQFDVTGLVTWLKRSFPRATTHHVEAQTGIPAASVENWLHRRSQPSVQHFSILIAAFGPSLLAACFDEAPEWVDDAAKQQRRREIDEQISRLQSERAKFGEVA